MVLVENIFVVVVDFDLLVGVGIVDEMLLIVEIDSLVFFVVLISDVIDCFYCFQVFEMLVMIVCDGLIFVFDLFSIGVLVLIGGVLLFDILVVLVEVNVIDLVLESIVQVIEEFMFGVQVVVVCLVWVCVNFVDGIVIFEGIMNGGDIFDVL